MYNKDDFFKKIDEFGMSNKDLSNAIGVSPGNICDWRNGRSKPSIDAITKIADVFNVSTDYLLGRENTKNNVEFTMAAYGESDIDLTPTQIQQIKAYVEFVKTQK